MSGYVQWARWCIFPREGKEICDSTLLFLYGRCILILTLIIHTYMFSHFFYSSWKLSHSIEQIYCRPVLFESLSFGVLCLWVFQGVFMGLFELFFSFRHTLNITLNDLIICFICHSWYAYIISCDSLQIWKCSRAEGTCWFSPFISFAKHLILVANF